MNQEGHELWLIASDYKGCMEYHDGETASSKQDSDDEKSKAAERRAAAISRGITNGLQILSDTFSGSSGSNSRTFNSRQIPRVNLLYNRDSINQLRQGPNYGY